MSHTPQISVVMSVYNGADTLAETLDSVLSQEGVDFEFIVVNDGSRDASGKILDDYAARDSRLRVLHQENTGLTRALIRGCAEARGEFIARQDAGDISLPGRLQAQLELIRTHPEAVLVSCGTRFVGPEGEFLYNVIQSSGEANQGLQKLSLGGIRGPSHHGSTLFRRSNYLVAGGYRAQFRVAQDLDLWLRLVERGQHITLSEVLYQAKIVPNSISAHRRKQQIETARLIIDCAHCRLHGSDEAIFLIKSENMSFSANRFLRLEYADALYFIARCLESQGSIMAAPYYHKALSAFPFHIKSICRLLLHKVRKR